MAEHQSFVFHPSVQSTVRFKSRQLVTRRTDHTWADIPDLEQSMLMHLWQKRHQFDPARGSECTFASVVLDRWIAQYLRDRGRIKRGGFHRTASFSELGSGSHAEGLSFEKLLTASDDDRRRWRYTESHTERSDRKEAWGVAMSMLSAFQISLLEDVVKYSASYAARQREVSRRVIDSEIASIRKIFIECGLNPHSVYNR